MSVETPTWDKIINAFGSSTTEIGGSWANLISDYYNGIDIGLIDVSKKPIIGTLTRYKHEKLALYDIDQSHTIIFSADDIDTGTTRKVKFRRMNSPYIEDYAVLEGLPQAILNKDIDGDLNNIFDLGNSAIKAGANVDWTKISKTGSKLKDLADASSIATSPTTGDVPTWDGTGWVNQQPPAASGAQVNVANTITQPQKIQHGSAELLRFYNITSDLLSAEGFEYRFNNSLGAETVYGGQFISIQDNVLATLRAEFYIRLAQAGANNIRFTVFTDNNGGIRFGNNQYIRIFETGLTSFRDYTLPDSSGQLQVTDAIQTVTNKTVGNLKESWQSKS